MVRAILKNLYSIFHGLFVFSLIYLILVVDVDKKLLFEVSPVFAGLFEPSYFSNFFVDIFKVSATKNYHGILNILLLELVLYYIISKFSYLISKILHSMFMSLIIQMVSKYSIGAEYLLGIFGFKVVRVKLLEERLEIANRFAEQTSRLPENASVEHFLSIYNESQTYAGMYYDGQRYIFIDMSPNLTVQQEWVNYAIDFSNMFLELALEPVDALTGLFLFGICAGGSGMLSRYDSTLTLLGYEHSLKYRRLKFQVEHFPNFKYCYPMYMETYGLYFELVFLVGLRDTLEMQLKDASHIPYFHTTLKDINRAILANRYYLGKNIKQLPDILPVLEKLGKLSKETLMTEMMPPECGNGYISRNIGLLLRTRHCDKVHRDVVMKRKTIEFTAQAPEIVPESTGLIANLWKDLIIFLESFF